MSRPGLGQGMRIASELLAVAGIIAPAVLALLVLGPRPAVADPVTLAPGPLDLYTPPAEYAQVPCAAVHECVTAAEVAAWLATHEPPAGALACEAVLAGGRVCLRPRIVPAVSAETTLSGEP